MTSTYRRGISNHLMVESFERLYKHLLTLGYSDVESLHGAMVMTFMLSGEFTREQAWEAADEILGTLPSTPNPREHDAH